MKKLGLPAVVTALAPDLRRFLERVRESFESPDGLVTKRELIESKAFTRGPGGGIAYEPPMVALDCIFPPAATALTANGAMTSIILAWEGTAYGECYSHTEVWRASTDDMGLAVLVGTTISGMYADAVGSDGSYYYWVRMVNVNGEAGAFNATDGVLGATAPDVDYLLEQLTDSITSGQLASGLAGAINSTFHQATAPTTKYDSSSLVAGDTWLDSSDGNKMYLYDPDAIIGPLHTAGRTIAGDWVNAQDGNIIAAINAASGAQGTADGKVQTFYLDTAPVHGAKVDTNCTDNPSATPPVVCELFDLSKGDLWVNTTSGANTLHRYPDSGTTWVNIQDSGIGDAIADAAGAQATADGKVQAFYQNVKPVHGAKVDTTCTDNPSATPPVVCELYDLDEGDLWVNTTSGANTLHKYSVSTSDFVSVRDGGISTALTNASNAQTTADGEIVGFFQDAEPGTASFGDLWIDTDKVTPLDDTCIYRYQDPTAGSQGTLGWVNTPNNAVGKVYLDAYVAQNSVASLNTGITDGTVAVNLTSATIDGTDTIQTYVGGEIDKEVVVFSGGDHTSQTGMKENDIFIESTTEVSTGGVTVDVTNTYKYQPKVPATTPVTYEWSQIGNNSNLTALADLADGKRTIYSNASDDVPTGVTRDIWIPISGTADTTYTPGAIYQSDGANWTEATIYTDDTLAATKTKTYYQNGMPDFVDDGTGAMVRNNPATLVLQNGDTWVDLDSENMLWAFKSSTGTWEPAQDGRIVTVENIANGKVTTYFEASAPSAPTFTMSIGDLWFNTTNNSYAMSRWQDTGATPSVDGWVSIPDSDIAQAIADAGDAQSAADGKVTSYFSTTMPDFNDTVTSGTFVRNTPATLVLRDGDLWSDTSDNGKLYRFDCGSDCSTGAWDEVGLATQAYVGEQIVEQVGYCERTVTTTGVTNIASAYATKTTCEAATQTGSTFAWKDDAAMAVDTHTVSTRVGDRFTTVNTVASSVDGIEGKYAVKIDNGGHVTGYGLISTNNDATPTSEFGVRADTFWVAPASTVASSAPTTGLYKGRVWVHDTTGDIKYYTGTAWSTTPQTIPFTVKTSPTYDTDGTTVLIPAGVYIESAFIKNAAITSAKIGLLAVDSAHIVLGAITEATIGAAAVTSAKIGTAAITTAKIDNAAITNAKIANAAITTANIDNAAITNAKIHDGMQSANFDSGIAGWRMSKAYGLEVNNNGVFRGKLDIGKATSGARLEINNSRIRVFDGSGNLRVVMGNLDVVPPSNTVVNATLSSSATVVVGSTITIVSTADSTNEVWLAPTGTVSFASSNIMTHSVSGVSTSIVSPASEGTYYLYVIDQAGNVSNRSTASITTTAMSDVVLPTSTTASPGGSVTIVSTGYVDSQIWLVPLSTTVFSPYTNQTKAASGTSTTILAPTLAGTYYIYIIDGAGNVSNPSTASVTVA